MKIKRILSGVGTLLLLFGFFLAFFPHAQHLRLGFVDESHSFHIAFGMMLVIAGLGLLIFGSGARLSFRKELQ